MNVRINIAENYKRTLANLDEAFSEWLAAASYIQTLTDIALPHIDSVVCAAMLPYAPPAVDLVAVGDEQEAAAWRICSKTASRFFVRACGFMKNKEGLLCG